IQHEADPERPGGHDHDLVLEPVCRAPFSPPGACRSPDPSDQLYRRRAIAVGIPSRTGYVRDILAAVLPPDLPDRSAISHPRIYLRYAREDLLRPGRADGVYNQGGDPQVEKRVNGKR